MASLIENLIEILNDENSEYENLLELSKKKTPVIISSNIKALEAITDEEQIVVSKINQLDAKRETVIQDIANVINMDVTTLKLVTIIQILEKRPQERNLLAKAHDQLRDTIKRMVDVNNQNRELIKSSLEMVSFDLSLIQAMKSAPETANYNRGACNIGDVIGADVRGFDAKQ